MSNSNLWNVLCEEDTLVRCAVFYGLSWPGVVGYAHRPVFSMLLSSFVAVPLSVLGTAIVATLLPKDTHGVIPLILMYGTFRCLTRPDYYLAND